MDAIAIRKELDQLQASHDACEQELAALREEVTTLRAFKAQHVQGSLGTAAPDPTEKAGGKPRSALQENERKLEMLSAMIEESQYGSSNIEILNYETVQLLEKILSDPINQKILNQSFKIIQSKPTLRLERLDKIIVTIQLNKSIAEGTKISNDAFDFILSVIKRDDIDPKKKITFSEDHEGKIITYIIKDLEFRFGIIFSTFQILVLLKQLDLATSLTHAIPELLTKCTHLSQKAQKKLKKRILQMHETYCHLLVIEKIAATENVPPEFPAILYNSNRPSLVPEASESLTELTPKLRKAYMSCLRQQVQKKE